MCAVSAFAQASDSSYDQFNGEQITYWIKSLGVNQGDATLSFDGTATINGQEVYLLTFKATARNFLDVEKIYADKKDFYPVRVERDLNIWGSKEKITESYDQTKFIVTVEKRTESSPNPEKTVIKKEGRIDNIYCFIYRFRKNKIFDIGNSFKMNLPTKDVSIKIAKKTNLKIDGKSYETYYLHTVPTQYQLWFDTLDDVIPLRIDKPAVFGGTSMVMTGYKKN